MCNQEAEDIRGGRCGTMGGLAITAYYAYASDIAAYPPRDPSPASFEDAATLQGSFAMKAGKYFRQLQGDLEMLSGSAESLGGTGGLGAGGRFVFAQAGTSKQIAGFLNSSRNRAMVIIARDMEGNMRAFGQDGLFGKMEGFRELSGAKAADEKRIEFTFYAPGDIPLFYTGEIPLEPEQPQNLIVNENGSPIGDENGNFLVYE